MMTQCVGGRFMNKNELRRSYRKKRMGLSEEVCSSLSKRICERIMTLPAWKEAEAVLCYMAFRNEVNLNDIMLTAKNQQKKILLPRVAGEQMEFYLPEEGPLQLSSLGILEPGPDAHSLTEAVPLGTPLLMLLPGLVFDREGHRIGYGGGFYDRYLSAWKGQYPLITVAPAFSFQLAEEGLPAEETDYPVSMIVTESETIYCG